jgi:hypothetical protein
LYLNKSKTEKTIKKTQNNCENITNLKEEPGKSLRANV